MSTWAEVIPLPLQRPKSAKNSCFSFDDERQVNSLLCALTEEMFTQDLDYEARARLYFYLGMHGLAMQRWVDLLSREDTIYTRQLGQQLADSFRHAASPSMLEASSEDVEAYYRKLAVLSGNLASLLQLIRSY
jgi:hypothetical protein